jgi:hypothetical protein
MVNSHSFLEIKALSYFGAVFSHQTTNPLKIKNRKGRGEVLELPV